MSSAAQDNNRWQQERFDDNGTSYFFRYGGAIIRSIRIGEGCQVYLNDNFMTQIYIASDFVLMKKGKEIEIKRSSVTTYSNMLPIIGCSVEDVTASKEGLLSIKLSSGFEIYAFHKYLNIEVEPWQIMDRDGLLVVAAVGGGIATWMPDERSSRRRNVPGNPFFD